MNITEIALLALAGVIVVIALKSASSVNVVIIRLSIVIAIVVTTVPQIKELVQIIDNLGVLDSVPREPFRIMLKVFSILVTSSLVSDMCRDNGENAIAGVVELSAKIIAVSVSIPVITSVISVATSFFNR